MKETGPYNRWGYNGIRTAAELVNNLQIGEEGIFCFQASVMSVTMGQEYWIDWGRVWHMKPGMKPQLLHVFLILAMLACFSVKTNTIKTSQFTSYSTFVNL